MECLGGEIHAHGGVAKYLHRRVIDNNMLGKTWGQGGERNVLDIDREREGVSEHEKHIDTSSSLPIVHHL